MNTRRAPKNPVKVYEVMTFLNQRSVNGRVVINPPEKMAPLETHQTGESWYFCYVCGRSSLDQNKHLKHMKEHNGNGNGKTSYSTTNPNFGSQRDRNTISRFDDYDDEYSEAGANSEDEPLINLYERKHGAKEKRISCNICREIFPKLCFLRTHMAEKHSDNPLFMTCPKCNRFHRKCGRKTHEERNHNPANRYKCSQCVCRLATFHAMQVHMATVHPDQFISSREKELPKMESSISASVPKSIRIQSVRKGSERSADASSVLYRCKKCQKTFKSLPALRGHCLIHTGEKPHECVLCSTRFRLASTLHQHKKVAHSGGSFECSFCSCTFHFQLGLKQHGTMRHGDEEIPEDYDSTTMEEEY